MKKEKQTRELIVEELQELKKKGFTIIISGANSNNAILSSGGPVGVNHLRSNTDAVYRVMSKMKIEISENDSETDILQYISDAKNILREYVDILKHKKSTPDLIDYINYNLNY